MSFTQFASYPPVKWPEFDHNPTSFAIIHKIIAKPPSVILPYHTQNMSEEGAY